MEAQASRAGVDQDECAIRELIATWLRASSAGDTEQVLTLMADDVVFLMPGYPPVRGKTAFAAGQAALKNFRINATSEIQEIRVLGAWAYCWTKLSVVVTPQQGGAPVKRAGNTLSILQKQSTGAWVIVRDANMLSVVSN
jgi:uncharacterized protein (TIGR02246 family)